MADTNRRGGEEPTDERLDDDVVDETPDEDDQPVSRGGTATRSRTRAESADSPVRAKKDADRVGIFGRLARFFREVVAELRKVIWPTRQELLTYTAVVVVFVVVMLTLVGLLDFGFAKAVLWAFGGSGTGGDGGAGG